MPTTITLPDTLTNQLQARAERREQTLDELVTEMLEEVLSQDTRFVADLDEDEDPWPSLEEVVARIKALPRDPNNIQPATEDLVDLLDVPHDPNFDSKAWDDQWALIEEEIEALDRADDIAEGRR